MDSSRGLILVPSRSKIINIGSLTTNFAEGDRKIKSALRGKLARESKLGLLMEVTKMGMPANSPGSHKFRSFE